MSPLRQYFLLCFTLFSVAFGEDPFAENTADFTDTTDTVFRDGPADGIIAAYGDFDSDKRTDVFVLRDNGHVMDIYFAQMDESVTLSKLVHNLSIFRYNDTMTSVVPGDFDGDSQMDVLITTKPIGQVFDSKVPTSAFVYWGKQYTLDQVTTVATNLQDQPLLMDYNADMIPDLFGADTKGVRRFWSCNDTDKRHFFSIPIMGDHPLPALRIPNSNAFLDLTDNSAANLFVTSLKEEGGVGQFEIWELRSVEPAVWESTSHYDQPVPSSGKIALVGQSSFADMNADGHLDHVLPVCLDNTCQHSQIYIRKGGDSNWNLFLDLKDMNKGEAWGFIPAAEMSKWANLPITLRLGDTNMDSYPDIVCILRDVSNSKRRTVVLENKNGESLTPVWDSKALNDISMPILTTFMDLVHTGILDILVMNQIKPDQEPEIHVIRNNFAVDAYFFKTHILSGLCFNNCPSSKKPYGVNQPGPFIQYTTTSSAGTPQLGAAAQLPQSAYFSLHLPYVVLGLGQNPNYVDYLTVSIPSATEQGEKNPRQHTFTSIIPNSEVIVIPQPLDEPDIWKSVLLITPGRSVLVTGGVLVGTIVFMAIVVGVLQLLEKREDDREKRQESHRFHFDAM